MSSSVAVAKAKVSRSSNLKTQERAQSRLPWLLVLPALILLLVVGLGPLIYALVLSFVKYGPGEPLAFVGIDNYVRAFQASRFWHGLYVTGWFVIVSIAIQLVFGFLTALALQRVTAGFRRLSTTIILIPMMLAPTVVGVLWQQLFKARYGAIDYIPTLFGIQGPSWLGDANAALVALIIADVWEWTPFMTILLLAGLQSLSSEVYEAAHVDGSTVWQSFKNMTLPLMKPFIFLAVFLRIIDAWKVFDIIFAMTHGGPGSSTETIAWYTFTMGFTYFDGGLAAALSIIQLLFIIIMGRILLNQLTRVTESSTSQ